MSKYIKKIILISFIILFSIWTLVGCTKDIEKHILPNTITVEVNEIITIDINNTDYDIKNLFYSTDDTSIILIDDDVIKSLKIGCAKIIISGVDKNNRKVELIQKIDVVQKRINITGLNSDCIYVNDEYQLYFDNNIDVIWNSSDDSIATVSNGLLKALKVGIVTISAKNNIYKGELNIEIKNDLSIVANEILKSMTLEQKIGQMFIVGFSGKSIPSSLVSSINNYHFGNYIVLKDNLGTIEETKKLVLDLQTKAISSNGIAGFIGVDQEGGSVERFINGATHFISNMAVAATGNTDNAYSVGEAVGDELRNYGFTLCLAPVVDVNNNPYNPVINIRSYGSDPNLVGEYSSKMIKGLQNNVMSTVKHFPGHGNTTIDTHYGLPTITSSKEELSKTELIPFIKAIDSGVDAIMSAHIIFSAYDNLYPATLSNKVITGLLRDELGFDGIIMTDAMNMNAILANYDSSQACILAVKAGVDILCEMEHVVNAVQGYNAILNAVKKGEISEERVDQSVLRILEKKIKYNINNDFLPVKDVENISIDEHLNLNIKLALDSFTLLKGNDFIATKSESICICSPVYNVYPLIDGFKLNNEQNSVAYTSYNYLKSKGYNVTYKIISSDSDVDSITNILKKYDKVVIALYNPDDKQINLVNNLSNILDDNLFVIATGKPYDINKYTNVKNYLCTYGLTKGTCIALGKYLNAEKKANGILPVNLK